MNILIKLTCLIGLVIAPILGEHTKDIVPEAEIVIEERATLYDDQGNEIIVKDVSELTGEWILDEAHSYVDFTIRHILASSKGNFQKVNGTVNINDGKMDMNIVIDVNSVNTGNEKRDKHLKGDEMFNSPKFPTITFEASDITKNIDGYLAKGKLTMMGVTKEVEFPFNYFGKQDTPWGFPSAAFAGSIIINKNDFGLTYGGGILGDEVKVDFSIELNPKQEEISENK